MILHADKGGYYRISPCEYSTHKHGADYCMDTDAPCRFSINCGECRKIAESYMNAIAVKQHHHDSTKRA